MSNTEPALTLADTIIRFRDDADLAHDFVKGDASTIVVGEAGSYPSLAKIAADVQLQLRALLQSQSQSTIARSIPFTLTEELSVKHNLGTRNFTFSITNTIGQQVYAPSRVLSENEFVVDFTEPEIGTINVIFFMNSQ